MGLKLYWFKAFRFDLNQQQPIDIRFLVAQCLHPVWRLLLCLLRQLRQPLLMQALRPCSSVNATWFATMCRTGTSRLVLLRKLVPSAGLARPSLTTVPPMASLACAAQTLLSARVVTEAKRFVLSALSTSAKLLVAIPWRSCKCPPAHPLLRRRQLLPKCSRVNVIWFATARIFRILCSRRSMLVRVMQIAWASSTTASTGVGSESARLVQLLPRGALRV